MRSKKFSTEVTIAGEFDVDWGRIVRVHAEDVRVANVAWAKEPAFFKTQTLDFAIDVPALFDGQIFVPRLSLTEPKLNLARSAEGRVNWEFGLPEKPTESSGAPTIPTIAHAEVTNGDVIFRDLGQDSKITAFIATLRGEMTPAAVELHGRGKLEGNELSLAFTGGGTDALRGETPYPVNLDLIAGATQAHITGTLSQPLQMAGLDLTLALEGESAQELETLLESRRPRSARINFPDI